MLSTAAVAAVVSGAAITFSLFNAVLQTTPPAEKYVKASKRHRWRNEVASLVHAAVVGLGAIYCWILSSRNERDFDKKVEIFGAISTGYLLYDMVDLVRNNPLTKVAGLCVHHIAAIGCFYTSYAMGKFYVLSMYAMLVDISSVFLHIRMLLIMHGFDKTQPVYAVMAFINAVTFATFRLGIIVYILVMVLAEPDLAFVPKTIYSLFVGSLLVLNVVLFGRLVVSDYSGKSRPLVTQMDDVFTS